MARSSFGYKKNWWLAGQEPAPPSFTLGTTKPDATNVGLEHATTTTLTGNRTYSTSGQTISDTRFDCFVDVTGSGITFNNCDFRGPAVFTAQDRALVRCQVTTCNDITFNRCRFAAQTVKPGQNAIFGFEFTANRCDMYHVTDGVGLHNPTAGNAFNVNLYGNWIHDLAYFGPSKSGSAATTNGSPIIVSSALQFKSTDVGKTVTTVGNTPIPANAVILSVNPAVNQATLSVNAIASTTATATVVQPLVFSDGSHNDCIQMHLNPIGVNIVGNRLEGFISTTVGEWNADDYAYFNTADYYGNNGRWATSCIMYSPVQTTLSNVVVDQNWIDGGAVGLNFATWSAGTGLAITNNRWGRNFRLGEQYFMISTGGQPPITITGNTYEDNGASYNTRH